MISVKISHEPLNRSLDLKNTDIIFLYITLKQQVGKIDPIYLLLEKKLHKENVNYIPFMSKSDREKESEKESFIHLDARKIYDKKIRSFTVIDKKIFIKDITNDKCNDFSFKSR